MFFWSKTKCFSLDTKFHLKQKNFEYLELNFSKKVISGLKKKGEYHYQKSLIQNHLGIKFHFKHSFDILGFI